MAEQQYLDRMAILLIDGLAEEIVGVVEQALAAGHSPGEVLNGGLLKGMGVVGIRFRDGEMFLPEVLMSAKAMKWAMKIIEPLFLEGEHEYRGKIVIGTVKGDIHDIGKNLVSIMLRGNGFEVFDLGIKCPTERYLEAIEEHRPDICGLSAMLTTTMVSMQKSVAIIKERYPDQVVVVGGAPVNQKFADEIGANAYGRDAMHAVDIASRIMARGAGS